MCASLLEESSRDSRYEIVRGVRKFWDSGGYPSFLFPAAEIPPALIRGSRVVVNVLRGGRHHR